MDVPSTTISIAVGGDVGSTVEAVSDIRGTSRPSETKRVLTPQTSETH